MLCNNPGKTIFLSATSTRLTDGRTDRQTEFLSLDRVCIYAARWKSRQKIWTNSNAEQLQSDLLLLRATRHASGKF